MATISRDYSSGLFTGLAVGAVAGLTSLFGIVIPGVYGAVPGLPNLLPLATEYAPQLMASLPALGDSALPLLGTVLGSFGIPMVASILAGVKVDKFLSGQNHNEKQLNQKLGEDFDVEFYGSDAQARFKTGKLYNLFHLNRNTGEAWVESGHVENEVHATINATSVTTFGPNGPSFGMATIPGVSTVSVDNPDVEISYSDMSPEQRKVADIMAAFFSKTPRPSERISTQFTSPTVVDALRAKMREDSSPSVVGRTYESQGQQKYPKVKPPAFPR